MTARQLTMPFLAKLKSRRRQGWTQPSEADNVPWTHFAVKFASRGNVETRITTPRNMTRAELLYVARVFARELMRSRDD